MGFHERKYRCFPYPPNVTNAKGTRYAIILTEQESLVLVIASGGSHEEE
jgi:hypothetical protein